MMLKHLAIWFEVAVVHRTLHPEKDGFDGRLRWIENGWQDSVLPRGCKTVGSEKRVPTMLA